MPRIVSTARAALTVAVLLAGCAGPGPATPDTPSPSASAGASAPGAVPATAGPGTPLATSQAASAPPDTSPVTVGQGEAWLAYAWYPDSLYLVRPDGSDRHRLQIDAVGEPFAVTWSADGRRLAFVVRGGDTPNGSIWTADANGLNARLLYGGADECPGGAFWPRWAPDGRRLAMVCYGLADSKVSILDTQTMKRRDLHTVDGHTLIDNPPSWAPDGTSIAFDMLTWDASDTVVESTVIATVPVAGGEATVLTDPAMFAAHPDWSPDGSLIAFNTYDTGNMHGIDSPSNVYVVAPDGSGLRQLSTASTDGKLRLGQPFWSSDGTRIWVSIARDWEKDSTGQFKNTLGWVDATTGELTEIGTEGKRFNERPLRAGG